MPKAYLTIDDSPWGPTEKLTDFLCERDIPAILFSCGVDIEKKPHAIEYAIKNGLTIANHGYAHKPAGDMSPQEWADDLELCEHLIEAAYRRCDVERQAKYYRFPYIDRGDGERLERIDKTTITENEKTQTLQDYLHQQHFYQPFKKMPRCYPKRANDCMFTYTTYDWMLTERHKGKHAYKTLDDLKVRIDEDESLKDETHNHVILMHDQPDIHDEVCALIDYFVEIGFEFLEC